MREQGEIQELMTEGLITIRADAPMLEAFQRMREANIRHLFVHEGGPQVVGIISDRDVNRAMIPGARDFDPAYRVKHFMSSPVRAVREDCPVQEVALRLHDERISALLVKDRDGKPRGVVTTDDFLRWVARLPQGPGGIIAEIGALLSVTRPGQGYLV